MGWKRRGTGHPADRQLRAAHRAGDPAHPASLPFLC